MTERFKTCEVCGRKLGIKKNEVFCASFDYAQSRFFCKEDINGLHGYIIASIQYAKKEIETFSDMFEALNNFIEAMKTLKTNEPLPRLPKKVKVEFT